MKNIAYIFVCAIFITSCELIVIREQRRPTEKLVNIDNKSAVGVVYLFKTELDSNNLPAATNSMAMPDGAKFLAFDRYEMLSEMSRIKRIFGNSNITGVTSDTLSKQSMRIRLELDYTRKLTFVASGFKGDWYIVDYNFSALNEDKKNQ